MDLVDKQSNPTIATYAKEDGILLRVTANAEKKEDADVLLQKYEDIIYQRVGDGIFATEDVSLSRVILNLLEERNLTLASGRILHRRQSRGGHYRKSGLFQSVLWQYGYLQQ